jgi:hypothetical protein
MEPVLCHIVHQLPRRQRSVPCFPGRRNSATYYRSQPYLPLLALLGFEIHRHLCHCGKAATKEAHFDEQSVVVIERYCATCSEPKFFQRLQAWYS